MTKYKKTGGGGGSGRGRGGTHKDTNLFYYLPEL
jgi:hypothetical protein